MEKYNIYIIRKGENGFEEQLNKEPMDYLDVINFNYYMNKFSNSNWRTAIRMIKEDDNG